MSHVSGYLVCIACQQNVSCEDPSIKLRLYIQYKCLHSSIFQSCAKNIKVLWIFTEGCDILRNIYVLFRIWVTIFQSLMRNHNFDIFVFVHIHFLWKYCGFYMILGYLCNVNIFFCPRKSLTVQYTLKYFSALWNIQKILKFIEVPLNYPELH